VTHAFFNGMDVGACAATVAASLQAAAPASCIAACQRVGGDSSKSSDATYRGVG
jgi:hypothetical protein